MTEKATRAPRVKVWVEGKHLSLKDACEALGLSQTTVRGRIYTHGWTVEKAFEGKLDASPPEFTPAEIEAENKPEPLPWPIAQSAPDGHVKKDWHRQGLVMLNAALGAAEAADMQHEEGKLNRDRALARAIAKEVGTEPDLYGQPFEAAHRRLKRLWQVAELALNMQKLAAADGAKKNKGDEDAFLDAYAAYSAFGNELEAWESKLSSEIEKSKELHDVRAKKMLIERRTKQAEENAKQESQV